MGLARGLGVTVGVWELVEKRSRKETCGWERELGPGEVMGTERQSARVGAAGGAIPEGVWAMEKGSSSLNSPQLASLLNVFTSVSLSVRWDSCQFVLQQMADNS